jgi:hypothetical protein
MNAEKTQYDWLENPPTEFKDKVALVQRYKHLLKSPGRKGKFLRELLKEVKSDLGEVEDTARQQDPMSFFKPSYEQALILNCWIWGIQYICIYTANRIGKTTVEIMNFLLWIFPNDPKWKKQGILRAYHVGEKGYDEENKDNPNKGKLVQVLPRPDISTIKKLHKAIKRLGLKPNPKEPHYSPHNAKILQQLQKAVPEAFRPAYPYAPWNKGGSCWMGAPDHKHHEDKIMPIWRQYIPSSSLERYTVTDREITIKVMGPKRTTVWEVIGLSYEQKETKWASGATEAILLTEGVPSEIFKEAKLRFKDGGIGGHDFTPYDPANTSASSALAKRIKTGAEGMPLPYYVFEKFSVYTAPVHILPQDKKDGLIASFKDDPQGKARLDGEFYTSSGLILSNLNREVHLLPWTIPQMFSRFPTGRIYRAVDPGLDHPTACAWGLLLPTNQWIIYRILSERGLDIPTRCQRIIELSGNRVARKHYGPGPKDFYRTEIHPNPHSEVPVMTICDYHTFKKDETTGNPYSLNYTTNGLQIVESVHTGPEDRAVAMDSALKADPYLPHIANSPSVPPGPKVFFLQNGPGIMEWVVKMESFYWERITHGPNKGEAKDQLPSHGDDELDAICYLICSPYVWTKYRPSAIVTGDAEPELHLQFANELSVTKEEQFKQFARDQEVRVFGGGRPLGDADELDEDERELDR